MIDYSSTSWSVYNSLNNLRNALIDVDDYEKAEELEDLIKLFWTYSIISNAGSILTIAGPQGVGKSTLTNTLLCLKEEEKLPTGEKRAERIPIVLMPKTSNDPDVKIYKKNLPSPAQYYEVEDLSYKEARERVTDGADDGDLLAFWYIEDNKYLPRISPVIVLPGMELKAYWNKDIKAIVDISDVIVYVTDSSREAQKSAEQLQEWIEEANPPVIPITVGTKKDTMSEEAIESFKSTLKERGFENVVFVSKSEGHEELWEKITIALINVPTEEKERKFKRHIKTTLRHLDKIEKELNKETIKRDFDSLLLDEIIDKINKAWTTVVKPMILEHTESCLSKRSECAIKRAREIANEEFGAFSEKIKIWFGGVPAQKIINVEDAIKNEFFDRLDNYISKVLENKLKAELKIKAQDISYVNFTSKAIFYILSQPLGQVSPIDFKQVLTEGAEISDEVLNQIEEKMKAATMIMERIKDFNEAKRKVNINPVLEETVKKRIKKDPDSLLISLGATGSLEAALEALGGGLPGATASIIGGLVGLTVALVSALAVTSSILRTSRQMEWEVENYTRIYTAEIRNAIMENLERSLNKFWDIYTYRLRCVLQEMMGSSKEMDFLNLMITLNESKGICKNAMKELL